jgi:low affinity Fe/Cu permease
VTGPFFGWSDTWQLVINTGTTIVTFLMVFVIQITQNRDTKALQLKLDELIRVNQAARSSLISLEEKSEPEVEEIKSAFVELAPRGELSGEKAPEACTPIAFGRTRAGFFRGLDETAVGATANAAAIVNALIRHSFRKFVTLVPNILT